jgi:glucose-6-phosphate 1-epimerase
MLRARLPVCVCLAALAAAPVAHASGADSALAACIRHLRHELPAHPEVSARTFDAHARPSSDLRPLIERASAEQPEFELPVWDYLARRVDAQRVADGRAVMEREAAALDAIGRRGVDGATTVAIFGLESDYGREVDTVPVVEATLARACMKPGSRQRRQDFFAALWLVQEGVVQPDDFVGSWAGAFGLTQFMPATYVRYMRDQPGDAPADILHSVPDALATTARYLRAMGWRPGLPWGVEVTVPPATRGLAAAEGAHACLQQEGVSGRCRSVAQWGRLGLARADGTPLEAQAVGEAAGEATPLDPAATAALLMPAGPNGPAWLVTANYEAIWRYNRADAYALAIGLLSDALRGLPAPRAAWPTDDPGLSRAEFRQLQILLRVQGHDDVSPDGAEGPVSRAAIRVEEGRLGWPPTGRAGQRLLAALWDAAVAMESEPGAEPPESPPPPPSAEAPPDTGTGTPGGGEDEGSAPPVP